MSYLEMKKLISGGGWGVGVGLFKIAQLKASL